MKHEPDILEQHFLIPELAKMWRMGPQTLRGWFIDEPGVIKFGIDKLSKGRKRTYISLRIPASVARRVYKRKTGRDVNPARVASG